MRIGLFLGLDTCSFNLGMRKQKPQIKPYFKIHEFVVADITTSKAGPANT